MSLPVLLSERLTMSHELTISHEIAISCITLQPKDPSKSIWLPKVARILIESTCIWHGVTSTPNEFILVEDDEYGTPYFVEVFQKVMRDLGIECHLQSFDSLFELLHSMGELHKEVADDLTNYFPTTDFTSDEVNYLRLPLVRILSAFIKDPHSNLGSVLVETGWHTDAYEHGGFGGESILYTPNITMTCETTRFYNYASRLSLYPDDLTVMASVVTEEIERILLGVTDEGTRKKVLDIVLINLSK